MRCDCPKQLNHKVWPEGGIEEALSAGVFLMATWSFQHRIPAGWLQGGACLVLILERQRLGGRMTTMQSLLSAATLPVLTHSTSPNLTPTLLCAQDIYATSGSRPPEKPLSHRHKR